MCVEAVTSMEGTTLKEAIKSEVDFILQSHTWELIDLPPSSKPLRSMWVFKRKMKLDGFIKKYNGRLITKGYKQCEDLDYFNMYSP